MQIDEIIEQLEFYDGTFPRQALQQAIENRDQIIPSLLAIIEEAEREASALVEKSEYIAHIYAMFLLAQFREERAYPLLVKFFSLPGELSLDLTGDVVTENLDQILALVSHGDVSLIRELAENRNANEYVRGAALRALVCLVVLGEQSRGETIQYFKGLFVKGFPREPSGFWNELVSCCTDLYPQEAFDEIKNAYARSLVDRGYISLESVRKTIALGKERALAALSGRSYGLIDTISEMESWACFRPVAKTSSASMRNDERVSSVVKNDKTGRNDPCPCGSGTKYKKCCG